MKHNEGIESGMDTCRKGNYRAGRRMFAIFEDKLYLAPLGSNLSHTEWFLEKGWIRGCDDNKFGSITRGMIDPAGDLYFYIGSDFALTREAEESFFGKLPELAKRVILKPDACIFGGLVKQNNPGKWPPRKRFGLVRKFL